LSQFSTKFLKRTNARGFVAYAHDIFMTAMSFGISVYLRLGDEIQWLPRDRLLVGCGTLTVIGAVVYWRAGLYRGIWRYASIPDLTAIAKAVSLTILIFLLAMFVWSRMETLPRSLPFINWFVLMALLGGPRLVYRMVRDRRIDMKNLADGKRRIPILLAGAGDGAELFIRSLARSGDTEYQIAGIAAETSRRVGQQIHGVPVLGTLDQLPQVIEDMKSGGNKPQRLILTKDTFDGAIVRQLFDQANELGLSMARVPKITEFRSGDPDNVDTRPIDVEDLLSRPQASLDRSAMRALVAQKRVLVTGAGGSIGSELVRQITAFGPSEIWLLDSSEYALYQIDLELAEKQPAMPRRSIMADVRSVQRVEQVFAAFKPELVFHAAALKHVPLVEENCAEGVSVNVMGTTNIADACVRHGVSVMVQISTDKAINPTNIMGATKRVAEQYCQALDLERGEQAGTNFVTVRFGNVLGSTGSVVPLFQKQLRNGGPLTVTHPDMTRYFMTIREAVELVLLASAKAEPGGKQDGAIFVLDMGEPVRIMDLAEQMIRLAGFEPGSSMDIEITGCRPGEKLFEEIFHGSEGIVQTETDGLLLAAPRATSIEELKPALDELTSICEQGDETAVRRMLSKMVPEAQLERL
jgi:FlaA1/EpsC-like NDP-sugar epimerase